VKYGLSGDYNSTIAKLVLSSNHGMAEKQEHDHKNDGGKFEGTTDVNVQKVLDEFEGRLLEHFQKGK